MLLPKLLGLFILSSLLSLGLLAQTSTAYKKLKEINKTLKSNSPYKGEIEVNENGELVHYQELYVGTRRINLKEVEKIEYMLDRYDTNGAPHSVLLQCAEGNCASVKWVDDQEMEYSTLPSFG